jgi:hypothetical protein
MTRKKIMAAAAQIPRIKDLQYSAGVSALSGAAGNRGILPH